MKHTPAPWKADTVMNSDDLHMEVYIPNRTLAYVLHYPNDITTTETEANARLIAAAPELLEALEEITKAIELGANPITPYLDRARAAIAKARGE